MQVQTFKHPVFGEIRTTQDSHGEPLFIASDMAKGLGYSSASALTRTLDDDEKGTQIVRTLGGEQQMTVITEAGFYHAAMKSAWIIKGSDPLIIRHQRVDNPQ